MLLVLVPSFVTAEVFAVNIPLYAYVIEVLENVNSLVDNLNTSYAGPVVFPESGFASDAK